MESNTVFTTTINTLGSSPSPTFVGYDASQPQTLASLQPQTSNPLISQTIDDESFGQLSQEQSSKAVEPDSTSDQPLRRSAFSRLVQINRQAKRKTVSGSSGDDNAKVKGDTKYKALAGDDRINVRKSNNVVLGGKGNDRIDAKKGKGDNILKGGGGADELIGGGRDDTLVGGGGADRLVIADGKFNKGVSIIKGFKKSDDIVILNVKRADEFDDLTFKKDGKDALIQVGNRKIALVKGTKPNALKKRADDFIFSDDVVLPEPITPSLSIGDRLNLPEGDSGTTAEFFAVSLNQALSQTVTVDYTIAPGSAALNQDFSATTTGTLTFAPGDTSEQIAVSILGDKFKEDDETFTITLANASGDVAIADGTATGTIIDDEDALAKIQGNTYSQSAQNQETLESQFEIYTVNQEGFFIPDEAPTDERTGTFLGAVQNFRSVEGKLKVGDDAGAPGNDDVVTENGFAVISDQDPLILKETVFDSGNLEAKLVYNAPLFENRTVIEYTLYTGTGSSRTDIRTSVLDIDDLGDSDTNPVDTFNDFPSRTLPPNFDRDLAINSLEYIVENHLLGLTEPLLDPEDDGTFAPGAVDIILQDTFEKDLATVGRKRKGNRYSRTGQNQTNIDILFALENVDGADQFIEDDLPSDANTGLFLGAAKELEDPTGGSFLQDGITGEVVLDGEGNPVLNPANPITSTTPIASEGNLDAKLIESSSDFGDRDVIQYTIFTGQGASRVDQFVAILDFNDVNGFGLFPDQPLPQPFDLEQAINSLTYIVENDLLSLTEAPNGGLSEVLALEELDV